MNRRDRHGDYTEKSSYKTTPQERTVSQKELWTRFPGAPRGHPGKLVHYSLCPRLYAVVRYMAVAIGEGGIIHNINKGQVTHLRGLAVAVMQRGFGARIDNGQVAQFGGPAAIAG